MQIAKAISSIFYTTYIRVICIRVFVHCREVNTFVLAGRDGTVSIWDHTVKKQLWQYPKYTLGVQDLVFNVDGSGLAVGVRDVPTIRLINELTQSQARQAMSVSGDSTQVVQLDCFMGLLLTFGLFGSRLEDSFIILLLIKFEKWQHSVQLATLQELHERTL